MAIAIAIHIRHRIRGLGIRIAQIAPTITILVELIGIGCVGTVVTVIKPSVEIAVNITGQVRPIGIRITDVTFAIAITIVLIGIGMMRTIITVIEVAI